MPVALLDVDEHDNNIDSKIDSYSLVFFAYCSPSLHGFLISCAYFATNNDAKLVLTELLYFRGFPDEKLVAEASKPINNNAVSSSVQQNQFASHSQFGASW
jgi:hypothetical protein